MHGMNNIEFVNAHQAKQKYHLGTLTKGCIKQTHHLWYNKACRQLQLTPNYISIKVNGTNHLCSSTLKAATRFCINQRI